jgi:hypothetical protein
MKLVRSGELGAVIRLFLNDVLLITSDLLNPPNRIDIGGLVSGERGTLMSHEQHTEHVISTKTGQLPYELQAHSGKTASISFN